MGALQEACLSELHVCVPAVSVIVMSGKLGLWLPGRAGTHLSALHTDVAQLLVLRVPKLTLQLVDRSEYHHLPAMVCQFWVREAAQAPVKGMQMSEDACAPAMHSSMMQHCKQYAMPLPQITPHGGLESGPQPGESLCTHAFEAFACIHHWAATGSACLKKQRALHAYLISVKCTVSSKYA